MDFWSLILNVPDYWTNSLSPKPFNIRRNDCVVKSWMPSKGKDVNSRNLFFIEAKAGCGKTHLYKILLRSVCSNKGIAFTCAPTWIAATLLYGGRTAHSLFPLPLNMTIDSSVKIKPKSERGRNLANADLFVINEVVTIKKDMYLTIDYLLQDLTQLNKSFKGIVIVFGGEFRQILPVLKRGFRSETLDQYIIHSTSWQNSISRGCNSNEQNYI